MVIWDHNIFKQIEMIKLCKASYLWKKEHGEAAEQNTERYRFQSQTAYFSILSHCLLVCAFAQVTEPLLQFCHL